MAMIKTIDVDGNQNISFEEFKNLFEKLEPALTTEKVLKFY